MANVTLPNTLTANTLAQASQVMANLQAIVIQVNGNLDATNLKDGAVTEGKVAAAAINTTELAGGAVTNAKLASGAVTEPKLADGAISDAKVGANAAIALAKLALLTAQRVLVTDENGVISASPITADELAYLASVQADITALQTGKQDKVTGGATTITASNLAANRALLSNSAGKVAASAVTSTELGYLAGVTAAIQTQLNARLAKSPTLGSRQSVLVENNARWTVPAGVHIVTSIHGDILLEVTGPGGSGAGPGTLMSGGLIASDGTNVRFLNLAGTTTTIYYWTLT